MRTLVLCNRPGSMLMRGRVLDLSTESVVFSLPYAVNPREELDLALLNSATKENFTSLGRVESAEPVGTDRWKVRCRFDVPLPTEKLAGLPIA